MNDFAQVNLSSFEIQHSPGSLAKNRISVAFSFIFAWFYTRFDFVSTLNEILSKFLPTYNIFFYGQK